MVKLKRVIEDLRTKEIVETNYSALSQEEILDLLNKPLRHVLVNISDVDDEIDASLKKLDSGEECLSFSEFKKLFKK